MGEQKCTGWSQMLLVTSWVKQNDHCIVTEWGHCSKAVVKFTGHVSSAENCFLDVHLSLYIYTHKKDLLFLYGSIALHKNISSNCLNPVPSFSHI